MGGMDFRAPKVSDPRELFFVPRDAYRASLFGVKGGIHASLAD